MGEWDTAFIGARTRATDTMTFAFERPPALRYVPGQFLFVMLGSAEARPIEHHFSFSSSPSEPVVEFTTRMTGSEFKTRLQQLCPGDPVHIAGPDGAFVLGLEMRKVAYLCGGIGITPARSAVRWALDTGASVDVVVIHGESDRASCAFAEEFCRIDTEHVRVVTVLSHPEPDWNGRTGRIEADIVRAEIPDWAERHFFVSGPAPMVDGVVRMLVDEVGVSAVRVMSEHFPGYADVADPSG